MSQPSDAANYMTYLQARQVHGDRFVDLAQAAGIRIRRGDCTAYLPTVIPFNPPKRSKK